MPYLRGGNTMGSMVQSNPYLRGSIKAPVVRRVSPNLTTKLRYLERKINRQAPETRYFDNHRTFSNTTGSIQTHDYSATSDLVAWADFDKNISGDRWRNLYLSFKMAPATVALDRLRLVVYTSKRTSTGLPAAYNSARDFTVHYDPSDFNIMFDQTFTSNFDRHMALNLRVKTFLDSIYDSINVTKGLIQVRVTMELNSIAGTNHLHISNRLAFQDK